jgi:hypothetical protein
MYNKKLIKSIKKAVIKQVEADIKKSVIKEFYDSASKKEIKALKKQILKEVQEKLFGKPEPINSNLEASISSISESLIQKLDLSKENVVNQSEVEQKSEEKTSDIFTEKEPEVQTNAPEIHEYMGFKFDTQRMSALVTGKARKEPLNKVSDDLIEGGVERVSDSDNSKYLKEKFQSLSGFPPISDDFKERHQEMIKRLEDVKNGNLKEHIKKSDTAPWADPLKLFPVPHTRDFVKYGARITPASKEDLTFFLGKLKDGISKLGKGERNINYRHSKGDNYIFSFNRHRHASSEKDDFSLNFQVELNIKTLEAKVIDFKFMVDGFNFDSSFFELIDIVKVLDYVGMNTLKYVEEIVGINTVDGSGKLNQKTNKNPKIKSEDSLDTIISDKRILKILSSNEIFNYGQLKEYSNNFAAIKGIGSKSAEKLRKYIK